MASLAHRAPRELGYRGRQVLAYIRLTIEAQGVAPSYAMICDELGLAHRGHVCRIIKSLESRGILHRVGHGRVRRIQLLAANNG